MTGRTRPDSAVRSRRHRCPEGAAGLLCSWPDADFTSSVEQIEPGNEPRCHGLARPARSAINDTTGEAAFYESTDCSGEPVLTLAADEESPSFVKAGSVLITPSGTPRPGPDEATGPADAERSDGHDRAGGPGRSADGPAR